MTLVDGGSAIGLEIVAPSSFTSFNLPLLIGHVRSMAFIVIGVESTFLTVHRASLPLVEKPVRVIDEQTEVGMGVGAGVSLGAGGTVGVAVMVAVVVGVLVAGGGMEMDRVIVHVTGQPGKANVS